MPKLHCNRQRSRRRRGAYTVEFAVCVPVLLSTVFGSLEIARYMYVRQSLDQTTYEAARQGVIAGGSAQGVRDHAESLLLAYGIKSATIDIQPEQLDASTTEVTVSIVCNYADNSWVVPGTLTRATLSSQITLDHENQAFLVPAGSTDADELNDNDEPIDV